MQDNLTFSKTRLKLAEYLLEPACPLEILSVSRQAAQERVQRVLNCHGEQLISLNLLKPLQAVADSESSSARFMLIHSPLEYVLLCREKLAQENKKNEETHLGERIKLLCVASFLKAKVPFTLTLQKQFLTAPIPIDYSNLILDLKEFPNENFTIASSLSNFSFHSPTCLLKFPSPPSPFLRLNSKDYFCYSSVKPTLPLENPSEEQPSYQLEEQGPVFEEIIRTIEGAKELIGAYQPTLIEEINFFVKGFVIGNLSDSEEMGYKSQVNIPGAVFIAPDRLLSKKAGEWAPLPKDSLCLKILVAGSIIHESRHQKHFYIHRCEDTTPFNGCSSSGFVRPEFAETRLTCTWTEPHYFYCLHFFLLWP